LLGTSYNHFAPHHHPRKFQLVAARGHALFFRLNVTKHEGSQCAHAGDIAGQV